MRENINILSSKNSFIETTEVTSLFSEELKRLSSYPKLKSSSNVSYSYFNKIYLIAELPNHCRNVWAFHVVSFLNAKIKHLL